MIYLKLFLTFLKIGAVSFGGGYGMIALMREDCLSNGWLTEDELLNFIGVAESTPGPIAVNMATFIGSSQCGFLGALCATVGVVLPSFVVILLVASVLTRFFGYAGVKAVLSSIRPAIVGMILATAVTMLLTVLCGVKTLESGVKIDLGAIIILALLTLTAIVYKRFKEKSISPILLVLVSAALGILVYGI